MANDANFVHEDPRMGVTLRGARLYQTQWASVWPNHRFEPYRHHNVIAVTFSTTGFDLVKPAWSGWAEEQASSIASGSDVEVRKPSGSS